MTVKIKEVPVKLINVSIKDYNITIEKNGKNIVEVHGSNSKEIREGIKKVLLLSLDYPEEFDEFIKILRES